MRLANNIPNILTLSRVFGSLVWLVFYWQGFWLLSFLLAVVLVLTDFFDGLAARALNQVSILGSKLDPFADKLLILTMLLSLFLDGKIAWYYALVVFLRDVLQLCAFPLLAFLKISFKVEPNMLPKVASSLNYCIILLALAAAALFFGNDLFSILLNVIIWISLALEVYILLDYFKQITAIIKGESNTFH